MPLKCSQCGAPRDPHRCPYCDTRYGPEPVSAAAIWDAPLDIPGYAAGTAGEALARLQWLSWNQPTGNFILTGITES